MASSSIEAYRLGVRRAAMLLVAGVLHTSSALAAQMEIPPLPGLAAPSSMSAPDTQGVFHAPRPDRAFAQANLRRLPEVLGGFKFAGESDRREWVVRLTAADLDAPAALQLAISSAISVNPEDSALRVSINGTPIGPVNLRATRSEDTFKLDIPAGLLVAGANLIQVEARQRHRVDCSIASTYELWSEVNPARSGLLLAAASPTLRELRDLGAIWPNERGELRIAVVMPPDGGQETVELATAAAGQIALMANTLHPIVDVTRTPSDGPGLDIYVGTSGELARMVITPPKAGDIQMLEPGPGGRARIAIAAQTHADFETALAKLKDAATKSQGYGHAVALAAAQRVGGVVLEAGKRLSFRDFGFESTEFDGRLHRSTLYVRMPSDFFSAETDKIRIGLDGGYAPALSAESKIEIRVNDGTVAVVPLSDQRGQVFSDRSILLSLGAFRPGLNRIEIDTEVTSKADQSCDTASNQQARKRLLVLAESSITTPNLPHIGYFPDLAATAAGGLFPDQASLGVKLFVPHPDPDTLSAAATLAARFSVSTGRALDLPILFQLPSSDEKAAIVVGASSDLSSTSLARFGIEATELRAAWNARQVRSKSADNSNDRPQSSPIDRRVAALQLRDGDAVITGSVATANDSLPVKPVQTVAPSSSDLQETWRKSVGQSTFAEQWASNGAAWVMSTLNWKPAGPASFKPQPSTSLILAQTLSPDHAAPWTLLTAATPQSLRDGVEDITAPDRWGQVTGSLSAFDEASNSIVDITPTEGVFVATQPLSFANSRLIAAGWLSHNPLAYAIALLLSGLLAGAAIGMKMRKLGQKG